MEISKRENIGWVDLLRVVACFLVVFSHCCDPFVAQFDNDRSTFLTGVFSGSFCSGLCTFVCYDVWSIIISSTNKHGRFL